MTNIPSALQNGNNRSPKSHTFSQAKGCQIRGQLRRKILQDPNNETVHGDLSISHGEITKSQYYFWKNISQNPNGYDGH